MRRGFTLTEVALSLSLVAVGVLALFMIIPQGLRSGRTVRFQILASAKAMELVELFRQPRLGVMHDGRDLDKEGVYPWDGRASYRSVAPDLETAFEAIGSPVVPLPEEIARRLDSEDDEIRRLIDAGGRIYYFGPGDSGGSLAAALDLGAERNWGDEARQLLVGVVGQPQQNSILYHPSTKVGPYQHFYPSPPSHGSQQIPAGLRGGEDRFYGPPYRMPQKAHYVSLVPALDVRQSWLHTVYERTRDPRIQAVYEDERTYAYLDGGVAYEARYGYWNLARRFSGAHSDGTLGSAHAFDYDPARQEARAARHAAAAYLVAALAFWRQAEGAPAGVARPLDDPRLADPDPDGDLTAFADEFADPDDWRLVTAMRFVAHAGLAFQAAYAGLDGPWPAAGIPLGAGTDDPVPAYRAVPVQLALDGVDYSDRRLTLERIRAWHECAVRMGVLHADRAGPYHWGAARPLNRQVMMDHPLVQLDPWTAPVTDAVPVGSATAPWLAPLTGDHPPAVVAGREWRRQWTALYAQPIREPGRAYSLPGRVLDTDDDGDLDRDDRPVPVVATGGDQPAVGELARFTLTRPFAAAERCRQLVFWAADWQRFEDFETCPSADLDAGRYPIVAPPPRLVTPGDLGGWDRYAVHLLDPMDASHPWLRLDTWQRMLTVPENASALPPTGRNPELLSLFLFQTRAWDATEGALSGPLRERDAPLVSELNQWGSSNVSRWNSSFQVPDMPTYEGTGGLPASVADHPQANEAWPIALHLGCYGANRDGVTGAVPQAVGRGAGDAIIQPRRYWGHVDRGDLPPSATLRATTVARFLVYDPRLNGGLFQ